MQYMETEYAKQVLQTRFCVNDFTHYSATDTQGNNLY